MTETLTTFQSIPDVRRVPDARWLIRRANREAHIRLLVLDDDPTGCQTVHDVPILTTWDDDGLAPLLQDEEVIFVLTNSRAYTAETSIDLHRQIASRLSRLGLSRLVPSSALRIISRSDSTLRGHYGAEVDTLTQALGPFDGVLVVPYFGEGGRVTLNGMHYVRQHDQWVEAHRTEFAHDPVFGFSTGYLPAWVSEKSGGRWQANEVRQLTLTDIRTGGPDRVCDLLMAADGGVPIVVDALCDDDLDVVVLGLCRAERAGKRFLYRTAASFVKVRAGMPDKPLLDNQPTGAAGLVVVGSHVRKTTEQVRHLMAEAPTLARLEVELASVFSDEDNQYVRNLTEQVDHYLNINRSVLVFTERDYALTGTHESRLRAGEQISDFLSTLVRRLTARPDFIIAKGGITSLDIARKGLSMNRGTVMGQLEPGVPVWQLGEGSKHPGLSYVVFPGNVGEVDTLLRAYQKVGGR